jgi:hypothetical protein
MREDPYSYPILILLDLEQKKIAEDDSENIIEVSILHIPDDGL